MVNVLVVDDSAFMRKMLSDMIHSDSSFTVIGTARDGKDAIEKIGQLKPDVITLDLEMPFADGLEVITQVMREHPVPIIVISGTLDTQKPFEALRRGAVDFILKPSGSISLDIETVKDELIRKLHAASRAKLTFLHPSLISAAQTIGVQSAAKSGMPPSHTFFQASSEIPSVPSIQLFHPTSKKVIVIATSTGGPQTLERLLSILPKNIPAPILIVQHMPEHFTESLAARLTATSPFTVREAKSGDILTDGVVLLAPGNFHMEVISDVLHQNGSITINQEPAELGVRPNANRLFISAANLYRERTIGIVLTGMGTDGTQGCKLIKQFHGVVIAQAEESCIVYGMPKSVVDAKLADLILPIEEIPVVLSQLLDI